nr:hypothetical protein Iba_chr09bCG5440 [Ipomoea batatas]
MSNKRLSQPSKMKMGIIGDIILFYGVYQREAMLVTQMVQAVSSSSARWCRHLTTLASGLYLMLFTIIYMQVAVMMRTLFWTRSFQVTI